MPLNRFSIDRIVPTEDDKYFRKQLVHGYVHDPGAAMLGGVCGHAGIFSDANDLAKLMQTYLNHQQLIILHHVHFVQPITEEELALINLI